MRLLVTLHDKLLTPESVDKFVCAEIPDKDQDPVLWYKVIKHMGQNSSSVPA